MKNWNIYYNLRTHWTDNKHNIGNTQMCADYIDVYDMFYKEKIKHKKQLQPPVADR